MVDWLLYAINTKFFIFSCHFTAYTPLGCFAYTMDDPKTTPFEGVCKYLDGDFQQRARKLEKCLLCAKDMGYPIVSMKEGGKCTMLPRNSMANYRGAGFASEPCPDHGLGGDENNANVYRLEDVGKSYTPILLRGFSTMAWNIPVKKNYGIGKHFYFLFNKAFICFFQINCKHSPII